MRKILALLGLLVLVAPAQAADNYAATAGSGLIFGAKDASGILYSRFIGCDNTTVSQCWAVDASGRLTVNINGTVTVTGAGGTFPATQSGTWTVQPGNTANTTAWLMNVGAINGVTPLMGNGVTGTGSQRVTIASDNTAFSVNATLAAETTKVIGTVRAASGGIASGALASGSIASGAMVDLGAQADAVCGTSTGTCSLIALMKYLNDSANKPLNNSSVAINVSTATTAQLVALSGSTLIYVTSFDVVASGAGNITFVYGTGASCGTGTTSLTGAYPMAAQTVLTKGSGIGTILKVPAGNALCITTSAAVQMSGSVSYQQF